MTFIQASARSNGALRPPRVGSRAPSVATCPKSLKSSETSRRLWVHVLILRHGQARGMETLTVFRKTSAAKSRLVAHSEINRYPARQRPAQTRLRERLTSLQIRP